MKHAIKLSTGCLALVALTCSARGEPPASHQQAEPPAPGQKAVYVWEFVTRDRQKTELTDKLTHDFEAALIQHGHFTVLERRDIDRLIAQRDNERAILDILEVSHPTREQLEARRADMILFGEVFDDVDSGQIAVTITLQEFDGTKRLKKPILLPRGKRLDAASRQAAMAELVHKLSGIASPRHRTTVAGFLFELERCRRVQDDAICTLRITNRKRDRKLAIFTKYKDVRSRIYDDANRQSRASQAMLAGNHEMFGSAYSLLLFGHPAQAEIHFMDVSPHARKIARLQMHIGVSKHKPAFQVELRDIPIPP